VPDLRYSSEETHQIWNGIVIGGAMRMNGMPNFEISAEDSDAIRSYILSLSEDIRASR
jgi:hypothetical protein